MALNSRQERAAFGRRPRVRRVCEIRRWCRKHSTTSLDSFSQAQMSKQIAAQVGLSEITVKVHRSHIMKKMEARSVADLVRMAEALGVKPEH